MQRRVAGPLLLPRESPRPPFLSPLRHPGEGGWGGSSFGGSHSLGGEVHEAHEAPLPKVKILNSYICMENFRTIQECLNRI